MMRGNHNATSPKAMASNDSAARLHHARWWQPTHWPQSVKTLAALCALMVCALLPHLTHLPWWIPVAFVLCTVWRGWIELTAQRMPPRWLRHVLALSMMVAVVFHARQLSGLEAGTALLSVMAGLKLLETHARRDHTVIVFIALFLLFAQLLYDQSMWMLPYLGVVMHSSVAVLLWIHIDNAPITVWQAWRRTLVMTVQALPLVVALFLLVPRLPGQFWTLSLRGGATSGLSEEMTPGDVSSLALSDEVAFRAQFTQPIAPSARLYWRAIVLHEFDGRTWRRRRGEFLPPESLTARSEPVSYRMLLEPSEQVFVPSLDMPVSNDAPRSILTADRQWLSFRPITRLVAINQQAVTEYQLATTLAPLTRRVDTAIPAAFNPRAQALATQWRQQAGSDREYLDRLLSWFHAQDFYYTLEPPTLGVHSVDDFLFTTRRGFCEHYASALAFLLRSAGIPARIVTGYLGGEFNPNSGYWVIRQADAHAWVEAWLPNEGWLRVDPTAAIASERVERGLMTAANANAGALLVDAEQRNWWRATVQQVDALNTLWKTYIVDYNNERQQSLLTGLGLRDTGWRTIGMLLMITFVLFFLGVMTWLAWQYRGATLSADAKLWQQLTQRLTALGLPYTPHEGPQVYLSRAIERWPHRAELLRRIRSEYLALRYLPEPSQAQRKQLKQLIGQL